MIWKWGVSPPGQAVAAWLSAVVSVLAIGIALVVFLLEQRRANAERRWQELEEQRSQARWMARVSERNAQFIRVCLGVVDEAIGQLEAQIKTIQAEAAGFVTWSMTSGVPHVLVPMRDSLKALQSVWQNDPDVVLTLSKAVQCLNELVTEMRDSAPSDKRALGFAIPRLDDLKALRAHLEALVHAPHVTSPP